MVKFLHENPERVIVRTNDGKILTVTDNEVYIKLNKNGRREVKHFDLKDMLIMNEELRRWRNRLGKSIEEIDEEAKYLSHVVIPKILKEN